jgi:hypothetical protein
LKGVVKAVFTTKPGEPAEVIAHSTGDVEIKRAEEVKRGSGTPGA